MHNVHPEIQINVKGWSLPLRSFFGTVTQGQVLAWVTWKQNPLVRSREEKAASVRRRKMTFIQAKNDVSYLLRSHLALRHLSASLVLIKCIFNLIY